MAKQSQVTTLHIHRIILTQSTRKPSNEVAPTTLATLSAKQEFSAGRYLFTISNSGLCFIHCGVNGFPSFTFIFQ